MLPCGGWNLSGFSWMCLPEEPGSQLNVDQRIPQELGVLLGQRSPTRVSQGRRDEIATTAAAGMMDLAPQIFQAWEVLFAPTNSPQALQEVRLDWKRKGLG